MKVEYRRDIQNSYLVLITENQDTDKSYDLRMITENQIEGLLPCERKLMNNDILYYYDVTARISLEERCKMKKIQGQEMVFLLKRLLGSLEKLEEYLLSEKSLCLIPQYIYMDDSMEQINFCYVPGENWDFQTQLRDLMEYFLPYLEHSNQESIMMGYGLYHYILRERFTVEGLYAQLNLYNGSNRETTSVVEVKEPEVRESNSEVSKKEEIWQDILDDEMEPPKKNGIQNDYWYHGLGTLVFLLWILSGWFLWRNFASFLWIWMISGVILTFIFIMLALKWVNIKSDNSLYEGGKIEHNTEHNTKPEEVYTQVLNIMPNRKKYFLKNENDTIPLNKKDNYIIGRDEKLSDIILQSTVISRKHGQIRFENNSCFLGDLYSKNGIRVNGVRLREGEEIALFGGEFIEFADIGYYFQQEIQEPFL